MNPRGLNVFVCLFFLPWPSWASSYKGRKLWRVRWRRSLWTTGCCTRPPQFHHHRRHIVRSTVDPSRWQLCERKETHSVILRNSVKQCWFAVHFTFNVCVCVLCVFLFKQHKHNWARLLVGKHSKTCKKQFCMQHLLETINTHDTSRR